MVPVTAGPGDLGAADGAARGYLRASHADREQVISTLKAAFIQGRLDKGELDLRVGQTLAARTYADLAAVTADLPTGLAAAQSPEPARQTGNKKAVAALTGATAALVGMVPAGNAVQTAAPPWPVAVALSYLVTMIVLLVAVPTGWLWLFHAWIDKRASRPSAQGLPPGAGGQAPQHQLSADPGRQLPPAGHRHRHTAEAAPIVRPRLLPS